MTDQEWLARKAQRDRQAHLRVLAQALGITLAELHKRGDADGKRRSRELTDVVAQRREDWDAYLARKDAVRLARARAWDRERRAS